MTKPEKNFGRHILVDFLDCDPEVLKFVDPMREILLRAAKECKATVMDDLFHQYEPFGVSGVVLIAESHLSVHTWPEDGFAGLDIFTCGAEMEPEVAVEIMKREFSAGEAVVKTLVRGQLET
ncbi:MAG: adenosylmethionine decarboxylase [Gammaproteobacteria bacterium]|nr:adenosylmethionine decarboxylase [Gammaproteobacteria bacterium]